MKENMRIAIYGGSFNPIHKGHISVAEHAIKELKLDKLFFVPAYQNPFKIKKHDISQHIINLINLVKIPKSEVSDFEIKRKGVSYSIDTAKYFRQKYPNAQIYLIIGTDNLAKLSKWKDIETLSQITQIVAFRRTKSFNKINAKKFNVLILKNNLYSYSSKDYRKGHLEQVDPRVQKYIAQNFLYIEDLVRANTIAKRFKHCQSTAQQAVEYAQMVKYDAKIAWFAGLVHDITKNWTVEKHRSFLQKHNIDDTKFKDYQLHQITAAVWLKRNYLLDNDYIIKAVACHTNLSKGLTTLDKIIFLADNLCQGRKYKGIQKDRQAVINNFEEGFKRVVQNHFEYLKSQGVIFTLEEKEKFTSILQKLPDKIDEKEK